jgi:hypothetical protein
MATSKIVLPRTTRQSQNTLEQTRHLMTERRLRGQQIPADLRAWKTERRVAQNA